MLLMQQTGLPLFNQNIGDSVINYLVNRNHISVACMIKKLNLRSSLFNIRISGYHKTPAVFGFIIYKAILEYMCVYILESNKLQPAKTYYGGYLVEEPYFSKLLRAIVTILFTSASKTDDRPVETPFPKSRGVEFFSLLVNKSSEEQRYSQQTMTYILLWTETGSQCRHSLIPPVGLVTRCMYLKNQ